MKAALRRTESGGDGAERSIAATPTPFPGSTRALVPALLPHALVACWLFYLGAMVWLHAVHSVQPPLYDALGYMQKAMNFWQALGEGLIAEALRVEPSSRPHGTILMSYPFGFTPDFRGFHFRSAFLPIVCSVIAVYIAAGALRRGWAEGWFVASTAFMFSSLPLFYHFDWREETVGPVRWGLVDNFQAGIAAIAAAALLRSLSARSLKWLMLAIVSASFTLLIKPSGLMVMLLVAFLWALVVLLDWLRTHSDQATVRLRLRPYALKGTVVFAAIYLVVVTFCVYARYLSPINFGYAKQALAVMQDVLRFPWQYAASLFHTSSGAALIVWCAFVAALMLFRSPATRENASDDSRFVLISALGCLVMWTAGAWYWLVVQAGGNQIRYFYPFMLMGAICLVPAATEVWSRARRTTRATLIACGFLPAINIGAMLAIGDNPPTAWQKFSGVSVSVGGDDEEVAQANGLLAELRRTGTNAGLYSFANGIPPAVFENVGMFEDMIHKGRPTFRVTRPQDWVRGFVVRTSELLGSDFVLISKYGDPDAKKHIAPERFDTFDAEALAFEAWLATLDEHSGVATVSDGSKLRLLRVVDRGKFDAAMDGFVAVRTWRPEFLAANQPVWWSADALPDLVHDAAARNVDFGGVYRIHALVLTRTDKEITIDAWWEELRHEEANDQRFLFLHLVDASGAILLNQQLALFPYRPPDPRRRVAHGSVKFNIESILGKLTALGFGIYQPNGELLVAESVASDYGGKRILVPVPVQPPVEARASTPGR